MSKIIDAELISSVIGKAIEDQVFNSNANLKKPSHNLRLSSIGKCTRYHTYTMLKPELIEPWYTAENYARMEDGNEHERIIVREFLKAGIDIQCRQQSVDNHPDYKKLGITGHAEFIMTYPGHEDTLAEVKALSAYSCEKISQPKDLLESPYTSTYYYQCNGYMHGLCKKHMVFILKNKDTSQKEYFDMEIDRSAVDRILEKAETVKRCVEKGELAAKQNFCEECRICPFFSECMPDVISEPGEGISVVKINSPEIIDAIARISELKKYVSETERLKKKSKKIIDAIGERYCVGDSSVVILAGENKIKLSRVPRKGYTVEPGYYFRQGKL